MHAAAELQIVVSWPGYHNGTDDKSQGRYSFSCIADHSALRTVIPDLQVGSFLHKIPELETYCKPSMVTHFTSHVRVGSDRSCGILTLESGMHSLTYFQLELALTQKIGQL